QLDGVLLQLLDVRTLNQHVQPIAPAASSTRAAAARSTSARGGRAGNVGAARYADSRALILAQHRPRLPHQLLLRQMTRFKRREREVEAGKPRIDVGEHALDVGQRRNVFLDWLDEVLRALIAR